MHVYLQVCMCMHVSVICNGFVAIIHIPTNSTNQWCGSNLQLAVMSGSVALLQPVCVGIHGSCYHQRPCRYPRITIKKVDTCG